MYILKVYNWGGSNPVHIEQLAREADVLARIPELIREHDGSEKVVVQSGPRRLFAIDREGNTLPG